MRVPRLVAAAVLAVSSASLLSSPLAAQVYLYALNEKGQVTVNATVIEKLASTFDPKDGEDTEERWWNLFVKGSDFYAIRADGRVSKTGEKLYDLNFNSLADTWVDVVVTGDDAVWALRSDGRISRNGSKVGDFNDDPYEFQDLATNGTDVFSLRSDGAIYRNNITQKLFALKAGNHQGVGEGDHPATIWDTLEVDPLDGMLHAIRRDGSVVRGDPENPQEGDPPEGEIVAKLPFGVDTNNNTIYVSLGFGPDGRWWAVRGGGKVYNEDNIFDEIINLPGDAEADSSQIMRQIIGSDTGFLTMRWDGRLYDEAGVSLVNLTNDRYRKFEVSTTPPDLSNLKNAKPKVAKYSIKAVTGEGFSFPVLATDTDKAADELVVTVDTDSIPAGATWDAGTRTFTWADPGPAGSYKLKLTVDDGIAKPVKKTFKIKVKDPDANDSKNRKPQPSKVKGAQVLAGIPFELPILVADRDGDTVTVTVDESKEPFTLGAVFEPGTGVFSWPDPPLDALGKYTVAFRIDDGGKPSTFKVKLQLKSSILAF